MTKDYYLKTNSPHGKRKKKDELSGVVFAENGTERSTITSLLHLSAFKQQRASTALHLRSLYIRTCIDRHTHTLFIYEIYFSLLTKNIFCFLVAGGINDSKFKTN